MCSHANISSSDSSAVERLGLGGMITSYRCQQIPGKAHMPNLRYPSVIPSRFKLSSLARNRTDKTPPWPYVITSVPRRTKHTMEKGKNLRYTSAEVKECARVAHGVKALYRRSPARSHQNANRHLYHRAVLKHGGGKTFRDWMIPSMK